MAGEPKQISARWAIVRAILILMFFIWLSPPKTVESWVGLGIFLGLAAGLFAFCYFVLGWRFTDDPSE